VIPIPFKGVLRGEGVMKREKVNERKAKKKEKRAREKVKGSFLVRKV